MFLGTYYHNLDAKNRLTIPSKILANITDSKLIISKGFDGSLELRTLQEFEKFTNSLLALSQNKLNTRTILRQLLANASEVEIDSAKRILIPSNLLQEANLEKEAVIIGIGNKCEIWNKLAYEEFKNKTDSLLEELAEGLDDQKL